MPSTVWVGLLSILLGVVLFARPHLGAVALAEVFGLFSLAYGVTSLVLAARTHDAGDASLPRVELSRGCPPPGGPRYPIRPCSLPMSDGTAKDSTEPGGEAAAS